MNKRPDYEALDHKGLPNEREARVIHELPYPQRGLALLDAMPAVSKSLGMEPTSTLHFGTPVYEAFKLTLGEIQRHNQEKLLRTLGCDLSLDFVPQYQQAQA